MYYRPWPNVTDCNDASKPLDFCLNLCHTNSMKNNKAMTATYQTNCLDISYNGWANYETWNVALWIGNDEGLYSEAMAAGSYEALLDVIYEFGSKETPDGVKWTDPKVNIIQLNSNVFDI